MKKMIVMVAVLMSFTTAQARLVEKEVKYHQGNTTMIGYLAYDDAIKGKRPGVLVVHEWWGHNKYARERTVMLAKMGYTALAIDMYGDGKQAAHPKDAAKFSGAIIKNMPLARARFEAALNLLKQQTTVDKTKTAAIGYCFGGGVVLHMARMGIDLKGVASFHGSLATAIPAKKGQVKAKVRVYHGAADPFVKPEHISAFKQEMKNAGVDYKFVSYPGVKHSFTNPGANEYGKKFNLPLVYDKNADQQSWHAMQLFFQNIFR